MGRLARQHGLACDNVVSYAVVTADGDAVRASADEHPDLFWGLRGGGGNFGIVVELEFRLPPVGPRALVVELTFPLDRAAAAMRGWRDLAEEAPRQATPTAEISGDTVTLDPAGQVADAAWAKQRLGRATQALPNGYCGLPIQKHCPHANACLTCPVFLTGPEFLPELRQQRHQTLALISGARNHGHERVAEMNKQVRANLDRMITEIGNHGNGDGDAR